MTMRPVLSGTFSDLFPGPILYLCFIFIILFIFLVLFFRLETCFELVNDFPNKEMASVGHRLVSSKDVCKTQKKYECNMYIMLILISMLCPFQYKTSL